MQLIAWGWGSTDVQFICRSPFPRRRYDVARLGEDDARSIDDIPIEQVVINQVVVLALRADDLYRLCERSRKEGFTPMPGLVAQARRHRRKSLILPSVSARRSESFIKKCAARSGNVPKSEARRETAQTEGRAHEPQGGEVTERGRDRRLRHARRRRRHVRGVTESLPSERRTNVVPSRRAAGAV